MSTEHHAGLTPVQVLADHSAQKRLGDWTTARAFQVRARHAQVTVDLRSPRIPDGDVELDLDLDHATLTRVSAITSREYLADARHAHAEGGTPTVDDPARGT